MSRKVLSDLVAGIEPSPTEETSFLANSLKRQGVDVISFAQGEPDFDTPDYIKNAAIEAVQEGFTKYTDVPGILELREAVVQKLKRQNNLDYDVLEVLIGNGGKQKQTAQKEFAGEFPPGPYLHSVNISLATSPVPRRFRYTERNYPTGGSPLHDLAQEQRL
jgi:hypothetical protein